jgi:hypothetical protein
MPQYSDMAQRFPRRRTERNRTMNAATYTADAKALCRGFALVTELGEWHFAEMLDGTILAAHVVDVDGPWFGKTRAGVPVLFAKVDALPDGAYFIGNYRASEVSIKADDANQLGRAAAARGEPSTSNPFGEPLFPLTVGNTASHAWANGHRAVTIASMDDAIPF